MNHVYRIENVGTQPAERITANDEERQRQGFDLQTTFEWAMREHNFDVRPGFCSDDNGYIVRLAYGPGATITRLNKGLRRRADRTKYGFNIDPLSGYWAKNEEEGDEPIDPTASPRQWIVPSVHDRKNSLLIKPTAKGLTQRSLATIQHALLRGIETIFQLEEGEILAEPMPNRDERSGFLLYEATEGGAGVLTQLVAEGDCLSEVARKALSIMHFDVADLASLPQDAASLVDAPEILCVAGCYRCLLSYYNQPDHELIDRRDPEAKALLLRLARGHTSPVAVPRAVRRSSSPPQPIVASDDLAQWRVLASARDLPVPDEEAMVVGAVHLQLVWRGHYVVATLDSPSQEIANQLENKGFEIITFSNDKGTWASAFDRLSFALGRSS